MSNIYKGLNEVNPHNYDSDIDYYNALNKPRRSRGEDDYVEPQDDEPIRFQQKPDARPEYNITKDEDRQAGYNMTVTVKAPTTQKAQWSLESYIDHNWGAKKLIGKITPIADGVVQAHMIDNHKYGMWKPWKDEPPISKPISFGENKEADYGADYQDMVKRVGQKAKEGPRKTVWDPVKRVYKTVPVQQKKEDVTEVSDETLISYLTKVDADSRKHKMDPTKRPAHKASKSVAGFSKAFNKLDSRKEKGVAENVDIGKEWMSDTELDQYVPDALEQEWRELVGYNEDGNAHPLWINMTGDYEPRSSDPQHRAWMVKVANKWFAKKKIPNVTFFDVRDHDTEDELEWLVQIGQQGVEEGSLEEYGDTAKGQKMLGKVHNRAADRVTSKKSDTDPAYARKAQQTQDRAWDRLAVKEQGVAEGSGQLSIQQLATISDEALDKAYGYGRSTPGNSFGWQANLMSAAYAKKMIDAGVTDIEKISDAIHKGWNVTAQKFVQDPDQFGDTEKLRQAGKLEAKLQQRAKLMKINYAQLDNEEQEKDRVVARALLQAIKGQQGVAEGLKDTVYPNAEVIKSKNGKPVGEIYQDGNGWGCFHYRADRGYDTIDSREDAIQALKDLHSETARHRPDYTIKGVAEGLNEFAPAGGGGNIPRGPKTPKRGPWDDSGEDPYQLRRYNRSIDFFDQFDSNGVDKQNFDKATGEYEGYYFDRDAASGITQIAYFKFDDPTKIGDNDPGIGWYYEPMDEGVAEETTLEESFDMKINEINEDWQKVNKKDKTDGMSKKAVKAYRRENPGSKLKTAVTKKPSKLKKGSKDAKRRKSFCARMSGMKKSRASAKTKRDPNSPINKALRRWNCESVEQMKELIMIAEQKIIEAKNAKQQAAIAIAKKKKAGVNESKDMCTVCGQTPCNCTHVSSIMKGLSK